MADDDAKESTKTFHFEKGIPVFDVGRIDKLERSAAEAEGRDKHYKDAQLQIDTEQLEVNRWLMRLTAALVFSAIISGVITGYQAHIAKLNASAAVDNASAAKDQARAIGDQVQIMKDQLHTANSAFEYSERSFRLDQRPYVTIADLHVKKQQLATGSNDFLLRLRNTGKTPAINVRISPSLKAREHTVSLDSSHSLRSGTIVASGGVVEESYTLAGVTQNDINGITDGSVPLTFRANIVYWDIFKEKHTTIFCGRYSPVVKDFVWCEEGNDVE